jgi:hypothetical protein
MAIGAGVRRLLTGLVLVLPLAAAAQPIQPTPPLPGLGLIKGGGTPPAIRNLNSSVRDGCPLVVPPQMPALQPLRISPQSVAAKNRIGCLSPGDAVYGPDGCPLRLCGDTSGTIPLPGPPQLATP